MAIAFERAAEIVARRLASFRLGLDADDPYAYNDHEKLCAGHIVGSLWGAKLLNTEGEKWVTVDSIELQEIARLLALLARCLKSVEGGKWRDGAGLSAEAHPVWDDVRETLKSEIAS